MKVEFVTTNYEEECGINTYTEEIESALEIPTERRGVPLGELNPLPYFEQIWKSFHTESDVLHIQHEYGIYGPASILSWIVIPLFWVVAKLKEKKIVTTFHSAWSGGTISPPLKPLKYAYVRANNWMLSFVTDEAIFLSEETRVEFTEQMNSHVAPHGIPKADPMSKDEARELLGLPDSTIVCLPGFARPEKGHEQFVETAKERQNLTFIVGGAQEGKYSEWVQNLKNESPENVHWVGVLEDEEWHALWNAIDVAWLPYNAVSQSGVLNWCVAYEVPTITSELEYFQKLEEKYGFPETSSTLPDSLSDVTLGNIGAYRRNNGIGEVIDIHMECYQ